MSGKTTLRSPPPLPFLARMLRLWHRSGIRGQTRITNLLAHRFPSLQAVPINLPDCAPLYVDLRHDQSLELLKGHPWDVEPWDTAERTVMRNLLRQGDVVLDIGANIGFHSVLIAGLIGPRGRLYAFEPNPDLGPALHRTVQSLGNSQAFGFALSDENRAATLFVPRYNLMASLANWTKPQHTAGEVRAVACEMRRLDDLIEKGITARPDYIKCDVEGAELMVFRGARNTLDRADAPIVQFEANEGASSGFGLVVHAARDFLGTLTAPRFRFFRIESDGRLADASASLRSFCNILAVPEARMDRVERLGPLA